MQLEFLRVAINDRDSLTDFAWLLLAYPPFF